MRFREHAPSKKSEKNTFLELLSNRERRRVLELLGIFNQIPLTSNTWLWVVGGGSVARGKQNARDVDIFVYITRQHLPQFFHSLEQKFQQQSILYVTHDSPLMLGIPTLLAKGQPPANKFDRPIHLIMVKTDGKIDDGTHRLFKSGFHLLELMRREN